MGGGAGAGSGRVCVGGVAMQATGIVRESSPLSPWLGMPGGALPHARPLINHCHVRRQSCWARLPRRGPVRVYYSQMVASFMLKGRLVAEVKVVVMKRSTVRNSTVLIWTQIFMLCNVLIMLLKDEISWFFVIM